MNSRGSFRCKRLPPPWKATSSGTTYYYHADQIGSTRVITDSAGNVANTYTYDEYGNVTNLTGTVPNPFQFAGQYVDSESGFQHLTARHYDPATSQFISRDP